MTALSFLLPDGLEQPYSVTQPEWVAIGQRVTVVIELQGIAAEVSRYIPNYPTLLDVCTAWGSETFPALLAQAAGTTLFAGKAISVLDQLSGELSGVSPDAPLPQSITFIITVQFRALSDDAAKRAAAAGPLSGSVAAFVAANQVADAAITQLSVPAPFEAIEGPITALDQGLSDLQSGWQAIAAGLAAAAAGQIQITTADLLAFDLGQAVSKWQALETAAAAFTSMVPTTEAAVKA